MNISTLVGLKNNLDYSKAFYARFREIYPTQELCFVSYGSTDGTHEWLDQLQDKNLNYFYSEESKTFSETFNKCAEIATKEYIVFCHNDIVICRGYLENILRELDNDTVVTYTTIEPPLFAGHSRPGKIVEEFGEDFETVDIDALESYVDKLQLEYKDQTAEGAAFFMAQNRENYLATGGMDKLFNPMFCEDDDLIRRLALQNKKFVVSLDSLVYHFVSKTSRFSDEYKNTTAIIEANSNRNFVRKWGSRHQSPRYNITYRVFNCTEALLRVLEPFCDTIYVDLLQEKIDSYIQQEQPNTAYDLKKRITDRAGSDITVRLDGKTFTAEDFHNLQLLPAILKENQATGKFKLGNIELAVERLVEYQDQLINL